MLHSSSNRPGASPYHPDLSDYNDTDIMAEAEACQSDLEGRGVVDAENIWLPRLVTMRRIVIIPNVNALGCDSKNQT